MNFLYDKAVDFASAEEIRQGQTELLREHLAYCAANSPFYRERFGSQDFSRFRLEDLNTLPITRKQDFSSRNDDFFAVPETEIRDIVCSSGTTGQPSRIAYTENDLQRLSYNELRCFAATGMTPQDRVLLTCTLDRCFVAGLAYWLGVRAMGASGIRNGINSLESHADIIRRFHPSFIVGVPSFLRKFAEYLHSEHVDFSCVKNLVCIGEPVRTNTLELSPLGKTLETLWNAKVFGTYSSSEMITSFCDCTARCGGHLIWDLIITEITDDNGKLLPMGEIGNVVVTPLRMTGTPFVRFMTGDVSFMTDAPCPCGRHTPRLGPILGRKEQMLKVRGTTIYPQSILSVMDTIPEVQLFYLEVSGEALSDQVTVVAALSSEISPSVIEEKLYARCRLKIPVRVQPIEKIQPVVFGKSRKPIRFVDLRKKGN